MDQQLPSIPAKRYFTIGEVAVLCDVKPHVLRYWEQEFTQLRPVKRRGNRRYYQHHEVLMIRRIRELLYERGFTISGARNQLQSVPRRKTVGEAASSESFAVALGADAEQTSSGQDREPVNNAQPISWKQVAIELLEIRSLLSESPKI